MGWPQGTTQITLDNETAETAEGFITKKTIEQRKIKAINMRYYWLRNRSAQEQFSSLWRERERERDFVKTTWLATTAGITQLKTTKQ